MDGKSEEEFHHCGSKRTSVCSCVYRVFERFCSDLWINMCDTVTLKSPEIHFSLFMLQDFVVNCRFNLRTACFCDQHGVNEQVRNRNRFVGFSEYTFGGLSGFLSSR